MTCPTTAWVSCFLPQPASATIAAKAHIVAATRQRLVKFRETCSKFTLLSSKKSVSTAQDPARFSALLRRGGPTPEKPPAAHPLFRARRHLLAHVRRHEHHCLLRRTPPSASTASLFDVFVTSLFEKVKLPLPGAFEAALKRKLSKLRNPYAATRNRNRKLTRSPPIKPR